MVKDDGTLNTFMDRYKAIREIAEESDLIVSTNFIKKYTYDEVDVTNVVKEILKDSDDSQILKDASVVISSGSLEG